MHSWTGPGSSGPHSRCRRSAVAGSLTEALLDVGHGDGPTAHPLRPVPPARELDRRGQEHRLEGLLVAARRLGEPQPHGAAVRPRATQQVVVHLHDELRARRERDADVIGHHPLPTARGPGGDPVGLVEVSARRGGGEHAPAEAGPPVARILGIEGPGLSHLLRLDLRHDHVVHDRRVVGLDLDPAHEQVGVESRVDEEAAVVVRATRGRRLSACTPPAAGCPGTAHHPEAPPPERPSPGSTPTSSLSGGRSSGHRHR